MSAIRRGDFLKLSSGRVASDLNRPGQIGSPEVELNRPVGRSAYSLVLEPIGAAWPNNEGQRVDLAGGRSLRPPAHHPA